MTKDKKPLPQPDADAFISKGGWQMWEVLTDIRERLVRVEERQRLIFAVVTLVGGAATGAVATWFIANLG